MPQNRHEKRDEKALWIKKKVTTAAAPDAQIIFQKHPLYSTSNSCWTRILGVT